MTCSDLQCVAVCCSVLQRAIVCYSLYCNVCYSVLLRGAGVKNNVSPYIYIYVYVYIYIYAYFHIYVVL